MTEKGPYRETNQDALCFRAASFAGSEYYFAAVCDGMGGLSDGEKASSYIIYKTADWFSGIFGSMVKQKKSILEIRKRFDEFLHTINDRLNRYSVRQNCSLGTTFTGMIFMENEKKVLIAHVGDTRAYKISDEKIDLITHDHSVVGEEMLEGLLTEESANNDERQNQLTKCIGAEFDDISYDYVIQELEKGCYMLCSDGFRKKITMSEIHSSLRPSCISSQSDADRALERLTELNIEREETDNITSMIIKIT